MSQNMTKNSGTQEKGQIEANRQSSGGFWALWKIQNHERKMERNADGMERRFRKQQRRGEVPQPIGINSFFTETKDYSLGLKRAIVRGMEI